mmetsp:Transcript_42388/g.111658  ORF Transcript_42388/g.111658 Transcript_42388/m.111658 type:complete len:546 (-) Transcript_42388:160-1797(-)
MRPVAIWRLFLGVAGYFWKQDTYPRLALSDADNSSQSAPPTSITCQRNDHYVNYTSCKRHNSSGCPAQFPLCLVRSDNTDGSSKANCCCPLKYEQKVREIEAGGIWSVRTKNVTDQCHIGMCHNPYEAVECWGYQSGWADIGCFKPVQNQNGQFWGHLRLCPLEMTLVGAIAAVGGSVLPACWWFGFRDTGERLTAMVFVRAHTMAWSFLWLMGWVLGASFVVNKLVAVPIIAMGALLLAVLFVEIPPCLCQMCACFVAACRPAKTSGKKLWSLTMALYREPFTGSPDVSRVLELARHTRSEVLPQVDPKLSDVLKKARLASRSVARTPDTAPVLVQLLLSRGAVVQGVPVICTDPDTRAWDRQVICPMCRQLRVSLKSPVPLRQLVRHLKRADPEFHDRVIIVMWQIGMTAPEACRLDMDMRGVSEDDADSKNRSWWCKDLEPALKRVASEEKCIIIFTHAGRSTPRRDCPIDTLVRLLELNLASVVSPPEDDTGSMSEAPSNCALLGLLSQCREEPGVDVLDPTNRERLLGNVELQALDRRRG